MAKEGRVPQEGSKKGKKFALSDTWKNQEPPQDKGGKAAQGSKCTKTTKTKEKQKTSRSEEPSKKDPEGKKQKHSIGRRKNENYS